MNRALAFTRIGTAVAIVAAATLALEACDDEVTPPQVVPGDVLLTLVSPNGAEGAVVLETTDGGVVSVGLVDVNMVSGIPVSSVANGEAFHLRSDGLSRIVAYRDQAGEISIEVGVEDVNDLPEWQIVEVGDGDNNLRSTLSGYDITVTVYRVDSPAGGGS
jgi:hypothetical protein